jgi:predicted dinucleotide-binding enzyme
MSTENEITQIVSRYTRAADQRDGEALATLYEADAVVEIHYHRGPDGTELLGTLSGGAQIAAAMSAPPSGAMAPHPPLGWSHHTTYDHLVSVDGDEASIETQFITFDVAGAREARGRVARRHLRRPGHHQAHRVRVLPLHPPPDRRQDGASATRTSSTTSPTSSDHPGGSALNQEGPRHGNTWTHRQWKHRRTLARLAVDAGLDVVLSNSRAPQTLSGLVDELGPRARAATPAQAAAAGDWVVVTIPVGAIGTVPREPLVGKTVIDTGNYYAPRDGTIPELEAKELTDSELLQRHLAEAHVVKAFNNIHYPHLRALPRPVDAADRTALPIAGNDPGAKKHAAELLSLLGYDSVDMGPLTESWRSQVGTPAFCAPYAVTKDDHYRTQPAAPASAAEVRAALASARR